MHTILIFFYTGEEIDLRKFLQIAILWIFLYIYSICNDTIAWPAWGGGGLMGDNLNVMVALTLCWPGKPEVTIIIGKYHISQANNRLTNNFITSENHAKHKQSWEKWEQMWAE